LPSAYGPVRDVAARCEGLPPHGLARTMVNVRREPS
jgi:hypothetical protein